MSISKSSVKVEIRRFSANADCPFPQRGRPHIFYATYVQDTDYEVTSTDTTFHQIYRATMPLSYSQNFLSESGVKTCCFVTIRIIFDTKPKLACGQPPGQIPEILQSNSNPQRPENHPETSFKPHKMWAMLWTGWRLGGHLLPPASIKASFWLKGPSHQIRFGLKVTWFFRVWRSGGMVTII
jgi:hypothetical protein